MLKMKGSTIYLASTLPLWRIEEDIIKKNVDLIVVTSDELYAAIKKISRNRLKVKVASKNVILKLPYYCFYVLKDKILRRKVVIYHECCFEVLDIFLLILRPEGWFCPNVKIEHGYKKIGWSEAPKSKINLIIKLLGLKNSFCFYECAEVGDGRRKSYCSAVGRYPESIKKEPIMNYNSGVNYHKLKNSKTVLLLIGQTTAPDKIVKNLYETIIDLLREWDFDILVKDHPNPSQRLNLASYRSTEELNPNSAVELMGEYPLFTVGLASTALKRLPSFNYSLIRILSNKVSNKEVIDALKAMEGFLADIPSDVTLSFPDTEEEFLADIKRRRFECSKG